MVTLVTNIQSANSQRLLNINNNNLVRTTERLSSGYRINRAADDPSGLGIAAILTSQIRGDTAAVGNIQQGTSMLQVADAGLGEITEILQRMRELTVQAGNSSLTTSQFSALDGEFQSLGSAITDIVTGVTFNTRALLTGAAGNITLQTGAQATATATLDFSTDYRETALGLNTSVLDSVANAATVLTAVDNAITTVNTARSRFGASMQSLNALKGALDTTIIANRDARSRIEDADPAVEISNLVRQQLLQQAGASALAASNFSPQFVLRLLQ